MCCLLVKGCLTCVRCPRHSAEGAGPKARSGPAHLRTTARQALRLRWAVILACSAAKAFSLLERPGGQGSDGVTPTTSEVIWEARYT